MSNSSICRGHAAIWSFQSVSAGIKTTTSPKRKRRGNRPPPLRSGLVTVGAYNGAKRDTSANKSTHRRRAGNECKGVPSIGLGYARKLASVLYSKLTSEASRLVRSCSSNLSIIWSSMTAISISLPGCNTRVVSKFILHTQHSVCNVSLADRIVHRNLMVNAGDESGVLVNIKPCRDSECGV